jgi:hypothetical protein
VHIGCEALFEKAVRSRRIAGLEVAQCEMPGKSITLPRAGKCSDETTARCSIGPVSGEASKQLLYLSRNWKFESISLQRRVSNEPCVSRNLTSTVA